MSEHIPVLLADVLEMVAPRNGANYVDGTFGGGGHSRAMLDSGNCKVLGIDRDPDAIARGRDVARRYAGRLTLALGRYSEMESFLAQTGETGSDGVLLDLGVSSFQLDQAERGFSFRADAPLDMRMGKEGQSAADIVNTVEESDLAAMIASLGEDRQARRIARAIVRARPIARTVELADVIARALGPGAARQPIHPATRAFQALRLAVNDELGELDAGLRAAERVLRPHGRLVVIAFHSLEDRIVKRFFAERCGGASAGSRHTPDRRRAEPATFRILTPRPRVAGPAEIAANPRARSAKLRCAERTQIPIAA